jgi:hypothetical protein
MQRQIAAMPSNRAKVNRDLCFIELAPDNPTSSGQSQPKS